MGATGLCRLRLDFQPCNYPAISIYALAFAWSVEFSQLYHAPWIDTIRSTRIGHLILGSTFNAPDLLAYAVGIGIGAAVESCCRHTRQNGQTSSAKAAL